MMKDVGFERVQKAENRTISGLFLPDLRQ